MSRRRRLVVVLVLNLGLVAGLVVVGASTHSLGVLAEGADCLADAAAIGVSLLAIWLAKRPPTPDRPHGYPKATAVAALVNAGWLLALSILVIADALDRLATTTHRVEGFPILIASGVAAAVMVVGTLVLGGDADEADDEGGDLNMRAVLLDTAADAAAAAGVAVSGAIILAVGGAYWLDSSVALVVAAVVGYHAFRLLGSITTALRRDPAPKGIVP